jgi:PAS domain S-box-containing protein
MENQVSGVWIIDANAHTLYASSAMAEILHTEVSAMVGESSFKYLFPEDVEAAGRLFESKQRGDSNPFHFRLRREDDSAVWVDVQGTPLNDANGKFIGVVGTFTVADHHHDEVSEIRTSAQKVSS